MRPIIVSFAFLAACGSLDAWERAPLEGPRLEEAYPGARVDYYGEADIRLPDEGVYTIPFEVIDGVAIAGGDMILGAAAEFADLRSASTTHEFSRWPECTVPYTLDSGLSDIARADFLAGVDHWEDNTDLWFVEAPGASDKLLVRDGDGCGATIGRVGLTQVMRLSSACGVGAAIHEIGHVVGLYHEQSRTDSVDHVVKHWDNMIPEQAFNFQTFVEQELSGVDHGAYDLTSIMHYPSTAYSTEPCSVADPSGCTLTHLDGSFITEFQRERLSAGDIDSVASMYDCAGSEPAEFPPEDDHANDFELATGVEVEGVKTLSGELYAGDLDLFRLWVMVPGPFVVSTLGGTDTFGSLYAADGTLITTDDDGGDGTNFQLAHDGSDGEQFMVEVRGYSDTTTGAYTLRIDGPVADPEPEVPEISEPDAVDVLLIAAFGNGSASGAGTLDSDETDVYRITVDASGPVELVVSSTGSTDTFGTLVDATGTELDSNDDTVERNFTVSATVNPGVFYLYVRGYATTTTGPYDLEFAADVF